MKNPWYQLPHTEPYILKEDFPSISTFNKRTDFNHAIQTNILPEPFLGNPTTAKVILLNLNPGFDDKDLSWHKQQEFVSENSKNLLHQSDPPFYLLNHKFKESGGFIWWYKHLKQFIDLLGLDVVSRRFLCIEYFPYHSKQYKPMPVIPSQGYTFFLVREAMKQQTPMIMMRGERLWLSAIPELSDYPYNRLHSAQNVSISKRNLSEGIFDSIARILS
jgi:hypothetical protein